MNPDAVDLSPPESPFKSAADIDHRSEARAIDSGTLARLNMRLQAVLDL